MAEKQETIADIIAEMRFHGQQNIDAEKDKPEYGILTVEGRIAQNYADRLEAAYKREIDALKQRRTELNAEIAAKDEVIKRLNDAISEEQRRKMATAENPLAVGDVAKLREAASQLASIFDCDIQFLETHAKELKDGGAYGGGIIEHILHCITLARKALAEPVKNCEVGTSDEQAERFENFCLKHIGCAEETGGRHCVGCPLEKASKNITQKCELYWAQLPYVEKEGGAK